MLTRDPRRFWDRRARENALYFVDSRLDYRAPDTAEFWAGGETAVERILEAVGTRVEPSDMVLDIGCGVGRLTRALAGRARRVVGLDISAEMLARARELNTHLTNVEWVHGDGRSLHPVESGSIDVCFSHVVFQHIPDPEVILSYVREMGRVLLADGQAVFVLSTDPEVHDRRPSPRQRARSLLGRGPRGRASPAWRGTAVSETGLRAAAAEGGLELQRLVGLGTQFTIARARRISTAPGA